MKFKVVGEFPKFFVQRGDIVSATVTLRFENGESRTIHLDDIAPGAGFICGGARPDFRFDGFARKYREEPTATPTPPSDQQ